MIKVSLKPTPRETIRQFAREWIGIVLVVLAIAMVYRQLKPDSKLIAITSAVAVSLMAAVTMGRPRTWLHLGWAGVLCSVRKVSVPVLWGYAAVHLSAGLTAGFLAVQLVKPVRISALRLEDGPVFFWECLFTTVLLGLLMLRGRILKWFPAPLVLLIVVSLAHYCAGPKHPVTVNPAVASGLWACGKITASTLWVCLVAQAAATLLFVASGARSRSGRRYPG